MMSSMIRGNRSSDWRIAKSDTQYPAGKISGDNIYRLLLAFDEVYHSATEAEQKEFMKAFIERSEMFPEREKRRKLDKEDCIQFPVPVDGEEVERTSLETETTVDMCCPAVEGINRKGLS